jgi:group I intron endonuclease
MKSFVYCITNIINGKRYVGKSNDPVDRWRDHLSAARNLDNPSLVIYQAMRKHGVENFEFKVVAECESGDEAFEAERRLIREWSTMDHGYNLNEGGKGGYNPSLETRKKLSAVHKGRSEVTRQKMSAWQVGKKFSAETREKIGASQRGKPRLDSEETRQRRAEAQRQRCARGEHGFAGRRHSEEAREKMRVAHAHRLGKV